MQLDVDDLHYFGNFLQGFFFGTISVNSQAQVAKAVQHCPIPGIYSGIFAMYLQHHESQKGTDKAKNILFYAICVLYALSVVDNIMDLILNWAQVSLDDHCCLTLFQLVLQNIEIPYCAVIQSTVFACCDFIAQSILVRTTGNAHHLFHSSNCSKDISLLDCVGLQHSCCDFSLILSISLLRSINLSSFTDSF